LPSEKPTDAPDEVVEAAKTGGYLEVPTPPTTSEAEAETNNEPTDPTMKDEVPTEPLLNHTNVAVTPLEQPAPPIPTPAIAEPTPTPPVEPKPEPVIPGMTPPPPAWVPPSPPQDNSPDTLTDIEAAVESPHIKPEEQLTDARDEVMKAFGGAAVEEPPKPIEALNAQPLGESLHPKPEQKAPVPVHEDPNHIPPPPASLGLTADEDVQRSPDAPPPVPPPIPFNFGNQPPQQPQ
jgi:hypothetical protein